MDLVTVPVQHETGVGDRNLPIENLLSRKRTIDPNSPFRSFSPPFHPLSNHIQPFPSGAPIPADLWSRCRILRLTERSWASERPSKAC